MRMRNQQPERKTYNRNVCPECGGMLVEKNVNTEDFLAVVIIPNADIQLEGDK